MSLLKPWAISFTGQPCTDMLLHWAMSIKKTLKAEEQGREDVIAARLEWLRFQKLIPMEHIVCLDESAAKTNMTRLYGRAMGGKRCFDTAPDSRWKTTTMLSSLRCDGTTACMVYEGGTTRNVFEIYIEQLLCPTLKPGDHVLMDNLSSHKSDRVSQLIKSCGAHVHYLPPYSPDLNPIEKMWSKMKAILRKLKPRSGETLFEAIKEAFARITHGSYPVAIRLNPFEICSNDNVAADFKTPDNGSESLTAILCAAVILYILNFSPLAMTNP